MTEVYEAREDSRLLSEAVKLLCRGKFLDLGTGTGTQAETALKSGRTTEITATDVNPDCRKNVKKISGRIRFIHSDLFEKIPSGTFDTMAVNPPYLPQDKGIADPSIYGGKKGHELIERFLSCCSPYLAEDGVILLLFSNLTGKNRIDKIIEENCFESQEISKKTLPFFECLYVYAIRKSSLLKDLEARGISNVKKFSKGCRGIIFAGKLKGRKVGIKAKRPDSAAKERISNEIRWLKTLNERGIGPELIFHGKEYFVYGFVEGVFITDFIKECKSRKTVLEVLRKALFQCRRMDVMGVTKGEMLRPHRHAIVTKGNDVKFIDFERCRASEKPKNVTQFLRFLTGGNVSELLGRKKISMDANLIIALSAAYKKDQSKQNYEKIAAVLR